MCRLGFRELPQDNAITAPTLPPALVKARQVTDLKWDCGAVSPGDAFTNVAKDTYARFKEWRDYGGAAPVAVTYDVARTFLGTERPSLSEKAGTEDEEMEEGVDLLAPSNARSKARFQLNQWYLYLDTCATFSQNINKDALLNIREADTTLKSHSNGGVTRLTKKANYGAKSSAVWRPGSTRTGWATSCHSTRSRSCTPSPTSTRRRPSWCIRRASTTPKAR